jgi:hypothetical protein
MENSYPMKIGTKLGDAAAPDYRPDGRVCPGHLTGRQSRTRESHFERRRLFPSRSKLILHDIRSTLPNRRTAIFRLPDIARSA